MFQARAERSGILCVHDFWRFCGLRWCGVEVDDSVHSQRRYHKRQIPSTCVGIVPHITVPIGHLFRLSLAVGLAEIP